MEYLVLIGAWILFFVIHSVMAGERCKGYFMLKMGDNFKYYRLIYSFVAIITLVAVLAWQFTIPNYYFNFPPFIRNFVGFPSAILASVLMAVCIRKYFYKLSGVEVLYQHPGSPVLETGGVHKFVRHPLYIATLVLIWSLLLFFPSLSNGLGCIMITGYVRVGIDSEERRLVRIFGSEYEDYKRSTPMLIPLLSKFKEQMR